MRIHPLALAAVLASATTSIDAFVIPIVRKATTTTIATKRRIYTSVATSTSLLLGENDEGIVVDVINSNSNELQIMNDESVSMTMPSLTLAAEATGEVEELQEVKATESPTSPSPSSLSTPLSLTPGVLAGVSFGTVALLGGLVTARSMLSQRQKKLDEEKTTLDEQQKRLETETTKLQKEKSQNKNLLLVRTT
jgi:hypothetical protein